MFTRLHKLLLATTALVPLGFALAVANPLDPKVVGGGATVDGQGTKTVTVTQTTDKAIIDWTTFNIGVGEKTKIFMPNSNSIELDRVTGGLGPSQIFGSLWSNGRVFLVNRDGILFGPGSTVDTAGFLATTNDIKNADFMAGRYNFSTPGRLDASIVNQGTITARSGGFAALVAPGVRNSGTISATLGTVALASGNGFTLDFYGDKLITLGVNDSISATVIDVATGQPLDALVKNEGTLKASGGRVELTAAAARTVVDSVINNTGVIEADTIGTHNGMIVISAATADSKPAGAPTQTVKISGKLSAAGKEKGTKGGTIQVTGENIALTGATLDASGRNGGGTVLIGGDVGGGKPSTAVADIPQAKLQPYAVATATNVTVDAATTINASAMDSGDGGKVVVWSNGTTSFNGSIFARGGANSGNGGFVETSGHTLDFIGARVDTSAPKGKSGLWLLDPFTLTIDSDAAGTISSNLGSTGTGTDILIQTTDSGATGPGIRTADGNGDIIVNSGISWTSTHSLTLSAFHDIAINAAITGTNGGLIVNAQNAITAAGNISVGLFELAHGAWKQIASSLPTFAATDFRIDFGASFLRALGGDGSSATPYQIADVYGLQGIGSSSTLLGNSYVLANDIDASGTLGWNSGAGFVPIGGGAHFTGQLDGQTHKIDKLKIAPTASTVNQIGLFGVIGVGGVVKNLNLTNVNIHANPNLGTGPGVGFQNVGALAGLNAGLIDNVTASGKIDGGTVSGVSAGGLVGQNGFFNGSGVTGGTIQNSSAAVNVTLGDGVGCTGTSCNDARNNTAGGLAGQNGATITGSSASGNVVVGANSQAGGLVGFNGMFNGNNAFPGALIDSSFAIGNVSSAGVNVTLGGLVGFNAAGALIRSSYATGSVTASADLTANKDKDCSLSDSNCQHESVGGLVGQNSGTILGSTDAPSVSTTCGTGQTCATGKVSVGSNGQGGGLVGWNDGIIQRAFATGAVTGAAGLSGIGTHHDHSTQLGGLAGENNGLIQDSFATGAVGAIDVANLNVGGLVADNAGTILNSFATGNVLAGDNSQAGGLTSNNGPWNNFCTDCTHGDGHDYFNKATIKDSYATGDVTVGAASLAGGLSGSGDHTSKFDNTHATGKVKGGGNSILGGLIGVTDVDAFITSSSATGSVTSTGSNSWVGGFIGLNGGTVISSSASGPVTGTSDSLLGGFVGLNVGVITNSTTTATVTAHGNNIYAGGFVGLNFGSIDPSTASGAVNVTGANNVLGSFAGANGSLPGFPADLIPGSNFPNGTISTDSVGSGTVNGTPATPDTQVGTSNPTTLPAGPSVVAGCGDGMLCSILQTFLKLASTPPPPPPPITQISPPVNDVVTIPPVVLAALTPAASPPAAATQGGPPTPGKPSFIPPPLPARAVTGPDGETKSFRPPIDETHLFNDKLVAYFGKLSDAENASIAQSLGLQIISCETIMGRRLCTVQIPKGRNLQDTFKIADNNPKISVAPIYKYTVTQADPATSKGDPAQYMVNQWHLDKAHALASGKGVTIAVIDSEVDKQHTELQGAITNEFDTLELKEPPHSHGTAMAAAIVSRDRLLGVAPGAKLLTVRAFGQSNNTAEGTTLSILKGIEWALSNGARVINMSFAGPRDPSLERALKAAHDKGVVLVAAAGNAGPKSPPLYPAADPSVIAVTATNDKNQLFRGANQGSQISVAAPGVDILAAAPDETYAMSTGTSIATAHVSGVVALMLELDPTLKPDEVRRILESTATDLGPKGKDNQFGWGEVNPQKALEAVTAQLKFSDASPHTR